jgi:Zinc finger, C3HC4 type (RING finger)
MKKSFLFLSIIIIFNQISATTEAERRAKFLQEMAERERNRQKPVVTEQETSECPICYANDNDIVLDCGHQFCQGCIDRILNQELAWNVGNDTMIPIHKSECPMCRAQITSDSVHPIEQREAILTKRALLKKIKNIGQPLIPVLQGGLRAFQCYYTYRYFKDSVNLWQQTSLKNIKYQPAIFLDLLMNIYGIAGSFSLLQHRPRDLSIERANHIALNFPVLLNNGILFFLSLYSGLGKLIKLDKVAEMCVQEFELKAHRNLRLPMIKTYIKNQSRFLFPHALGVVARYNFGTFTDIQLQNGQMYTKPSWRALLSKKGLLFAAGAAAGGYYAPQLYQTTSKLADMYSSVLTKCLW